MLIGSEPGPRQWPGPLLVSGVAQTSVTPDVDHTVETGLDSREKQDGNVKRLTGPSSGTVTELARYSQSNREREGPCFGPPFQLILP